MEIPRIAEKPLESLTREQKLAIASLIDSEGFKALKEMTEYYVRGSVVDELLSNGTMTPEQLVYYTRGMAMGSRWVIDQVSKASKIVNDKK